MEYNTEKNVTSIKTLLDFIKGDTEQVLEMLSLEASNDDLDLAWRLCEMIGDYAEQARVLIGKMSDERKDMEGA